MEKKQKSKIKTKQISESGSNKGKISKRVNFNTEEDERKEYEETRASTYFPKLAQEIANPKKNSKNACLKPINKLQVLSGEVMVGKGWKFVRDYFWNRVKERKMKKILSLKA